MRLKFALLCGMLAAVPCAAAPPTIHGTVTAVHDGDAFSIGRVRIRVFGIDAPSSISNAAPTRSTSRAPHPASRAAIRRVTRSPQ